MDKEYILLSEIDKNKNITQRELSKKTQLSLGTVNILLNKMVHEGFIKIKQIPMNRVAYMLTPAGIAEKVKKTGNYIRIHYKYINDTKKKIKNAILCLIIEHTSTGIILEQDEISELVKLAISELHNKQYIRIYEQYSLDEDYTINDILLVLSLQTYDMLMDHHKVKVLNLLELI